MPADPAPRSAGGGGSEPAPSQASLADAGAAQPAPSNLFEQLVPNGVRRLFATMLVVSAASFVADQGTYANFTATVESPNNIFTTGSLELSLSTSNFSASSSGTLNGMVPGDVVVGTIAVRNAGTVPARTYTVTTSVATPSALSANTADALQLSVDRCSVAWSGPAPFTCPGTLTTAVVSGTLVQNNVSMGRTLPGETTDYLRVSVRLPQTAGNSYQLLSATVTFRWDVIQ